MWWRTGGLHLREATPCLPAGGATAPGLCDGVGSEKGWGSRVLRVGEEERAEAEAEAGGVAVAASPVSR